MDKSSYVHAKTEQNNLRKALQLTPDTDSPWEKVHYQDWKDKITVICLSAVQKVAMIGINHKNPLSWIYTPKLVDPTKTVRNHDDNIEGLQYLHPLLLDSPWEEPAFLVDLIPSARNNTSHLFTRINAEREQHLVRQRVYKKAKGSPTVLTLRQSKTHSALRTLELIEQHYVKENENSVHILWTFISGNP